MLLSIEQPWANGASVTGTPTYAAGRLGGAIEIGATSVSLPTAGLVTSTEGCVDIDFTPLAFTPADPVTNVLTFALGATAARLVTLRKRFSDGAWLIVLRNGATNTTVVLPGVTDGQPLRVSVGWKASGVYRVVAGGLQVASGAYTAGDLSFDRVTIAGGAWRLEAVRYSSVERTAAAMAADYGKPLSLDAAATALLTVPVGGPALFLVQNGKSVDLPAPLRPESSREDAAVQLSGRDSAGNLYLYRRGTTRRVRHGVRVVMPATQFAALETFVRDQAQGVRRLVTWHDHAMVPRAVRFDSGELTGTPTHGRMVTSLSLIEERA